MKKNHLAAVDPWKTEDSGYDEDQFYMRSTDGHGHFRHLRVNAPPQLAGQIHELVQADNLPYRTTQDFIRDAITHRMHYIQELMKSGQLERVLTAEIRKAKMEHVNRERQDLAGLVDACREAITAASLDRDWVALTHALEQAEMHGEEVREPYQSRIHDLVNEYRAKHIRDLT